MKQTAVEYLIEKHFGSIENCTPNFRKNINQAKEMEIIKDVKYNKMLEMLQEIKNQIEDGRTYVTKEDIGKLIKEATEI